MSLSVDPTLFREVMGNYPTGVAVVTAIAEDGSPAGMVVGTFSSVSLDPPLIAFFPGRSSASFALIRTARSFCINVLASDQEPLCRQFATGGASKFDGVGWHPGPLGAPVLDDAVSWIECTFDDIRDAGDHFVVLGLVHEFAVARATLPLLFFQGGYGRFTPGSFIAAPEAELIQAAQFAETIRSRVESLSAEYAVNCGVLAKVGWNAVQVLAANRSPVTEPFPLGHRQPLMPPFGAALMVNATEDEVGEWLGRAPQDDEVHRELNRDLLAKVRGRGFSLLTADSAVVQRHTTVLTEFELSGLPQHERIVRQTTAELADHFGSDLIPGRRYDLANVVVPLPPRPGLPPMALRITGLPGGVETAQIDTWVRALERIADVTTSAGRP